MIERYFDNAATSPVDPRVIEEMLPYFSDAFGNANSIHEPGRRASHAVDLARSRVAHLFGLDDPNQVVFTSGATEANNWVLQRGGTVAVSPFEHASIREAALALNARILSNDNYDLSYGDRSADLISVMGVNNETGAILHPPAIGGSALHRDLTQAVGKVNLSQFEFDLASCSAHKLYGPKGVGALILKEPVSIEPLLYGGEHELGLRAGTLNVPGIVGMGVAAAIAADEAENDRRTVVELRALALHELKNLTDFQLNTPPGSSPYIVSLSFLGVEGETLVIELDRAGFSISSGAACSSKSTEPSHVLVALGMDPVWIRGTIRISFGKYNTGAAATSLGKELRRVVEKLRTMH
ncbi:MAG TPA: cysteine desulfurase family protein [Fimbriimonadaceae bacterium]|nr:cysteine desulfurase family protein [Fimbriimonadaceae bacterium]